MASLNGMVSLSSCEIVSYFTLLSLSIISWKSVQTDIVFGKTSSIIIIIIVVVYYSCHASAFVAYMQLNLCLTLGNIIELKYLFDKQ
jgi:hypothetical protein